jgi:GxxExxY protein
MKSDQRPETRRPETETPTRAPIPAATERIASEVIGAAIEVHRHLGPGFLEKIYQEALCVELCARRISFERQKSIAVTYKGVMIPGQRIDLVVAGCVLVELKATSTVHAIHEAKVISYLKTTGLRLGLLLNFHEVTLKQGLKRIVY